jgi:hypothetical protein
MSNAVMLVFLMQGTCEICCWSGLRWHDMHTEIHGYQFRNSGITNVISFTTWEAEILFPLMGAISRVWRSDYFKHRDITDEIHEDGYMNL